MTPPAGSRAIQQARALCANRRFTEAAGVLKKHVKANPKDAEALGLLAVAQSDGGDPAAARKTIARALKIRPKSPELLCWSGGILAKNESPEEAIAQYRAALAIAPGAAPVVRGLVDVLLGQGRADEALGVLESPGGIDPESADALLAMVKVCAALGRNERGLRAAEALLANDRVGGYARVQAAFARGKFLVGLGETDRAFAAYREANELRSAPFDARRNARQTDRMIEAWTPGALGAIPASRRKSDRAVFIVGMPRSGTSLVEQIASSHPRVFGAGELPLIHRIVKRFNGGDPEPIQFLADPAVLTAESVDAASRHYLETTRAMAPGADRITDKMPYNFRDLGMISKLFPDAKIVHCVRDPRDTCLSCYFNYFMSRENSFTFDLADLGSFYSDYRRLMNHWKSVLGIPILDVVYEEMVADQESQSRRLIEYLDLDWDDRCIEFHRSKRRAKTISREQVNKPIYTSSVARWKPYEQHLGPLLERLPAGSLHD